MANRYFSGPVQTLETEIKQLHGTVVFGASGAVTTALNKGFTVVKTATETGRYTLTMGKSDAIDTYYEFKGLNAIVEGPTDAAVAGGFIPIIRNVDTTNGFSTVEVQLVDAAGADAEPTSGNKLYITLHVKNSSVAF